MPVRVAGEGAISSYIRKVGVSEGKKYLIGILKPNYFLLVLEH
ncbi:MULTISPECIES: hypothetical protein [unclassified Clostridium]|nr:MULTISPECIES: hypothetical protein [unclassified Clostridium]